PDTLDPSDDPDEPPTPLPVPIIRPHVEPAPDAPAPPAEPPAPPRPPTRYWLDVHAGYALRSLAHIANHGVAGAMGVAGEPRKDFLVGGALRFFDGSTPNGLETFDGRLGPEVGVGTGRVGVGLGADLFLAGLVRSTSGGVIVDEGAAFRL